jgi:hypothetical protein
MVNELHPLKMHEIFVNAFLAIRERFWAFQGVLYLSFLPALLILGLAMIAVFISLLMTPPNSSVIYDIPAFLFERLSAALPILILVMIPLGLLFFVTMTIGSLWFVYGTIRVFDAWRSQSPLTTKEAMRGGNSRLPGLLLFLGFLLLVVLVIVTLAIALHILFAPYDRSGILSILFSFLYNILFSFMAGLTMIIITRENPPFFKALSQNFRLLLHKNLFWRNLGFFTLFQTALQLLSFLVVLLLMIPFLIPILAMNILAVFSINPTILIFTAFASLFLAILLLKFLIPFSIGPLLFLYYDLQARKNVF